MRGLAAAAAALAGDDPPAVCTTLQRWHDHGQRELPWLAGPCLSALRRAGVTVTTEGDVRVVQRFLVGAEFEPQAVMDAIDRCEVNAGDPRPALPPDASGALADAVDDFFELLASAYAELHEPVRQGHRRDADALIARWQERLDDAADEVDARGRVLSGQRPVAARPQRARGARDRPGCALLFVVVALLTAAVMMLAVLQGWPAEPFELPL